MSHRYREEKIKREHTIVKELVILLEEIAKKPLVKSIIPGRINRRKGSGHQPYLQLQYLTETGFKILGKTSSSVQEVFVVTDDAKKVVEELKKSNLIV